MEMTGASGLGFGGLVRWGGAVGRVAQIVRVASGRDLTILLACVRRRGRLQINDWKKSFNWRVQKLAWVVLR